jgi:hypothetical protein
MASPGSRLVRTSPDHPIEFLGRGLVRALPDQPVSPASREQSQIPDAPVPTTCHYDPPYAPKGRNLQSLLESSRIPSSEATSEERQPWFEIRGDILPDHIVEGTRNRKRKEAYAALVQQPHTNSAIYAAFMTGMKRIHRDELPPPPNHW